MRLLLIFWVTCPFALQMSAFDPKRTSVSPKWLCQLKTCDHKSHAFFWVPKADLSQINVTERCSCSQFFAFAHHSGKEIRATR